MLKAIKAGLAPLIVILLVATPVFAYLYRASITIVESDGNAYFMLPMEVEANNQWMADNGFMEADALDTRVQTFTGTNKPHMVSTDATLFSIPVSANSQTNLYFMTGESDLSAMYVITGHGGYITIPDDASLELDDNFEIEMKGYIDTTAGEGRYLITKDNAFVVNIDGAGTITATITGGTSVSATTIASGVHTVLITADETNLKIFIDTVQKDSSALGGVGIPDVATDWLICIDQDGDVVPYLEYMTVINGG